MKYAIRRTSDWKNGFEKPCSEAYQDGVNKYDEPNWCIDITSLEMLLDIISETNCPIIVGTKHIEIYDDFRE